MAKNCPKWSEMFGKMAQMRLVIPTSNCQTENGEKLPKNTAKWKKLLKIAKMAKKYQKITENAPKLSEMLSQMVQMRPGTPTPNCLIQKGDISMKNSKNLPKWL